LITAEGIAARLAPLDAIGTGPQGVTRMAWSEEDAASRAWFAEQAQRGGLIARRDPAGSLWACPQTEPPWWGVGSHLDSVRDGGRFDGPLGVACAFEIAADVQRPLAVISFADEEGARFNTPTFGSKALAGRLDVAAVLARRDDGGLSVAAAMRDAGIDPDGVVEAPTWASRLRGFVEVHIDQSTDVARAGVPVGIVSSLAARRRLEAELRGRADHSGTTPPSERRDALAAAARLIVAAQDCAGPVTVTTSRMLVEPNAPTTIPAHARLWIDARSLDPAHIDRWLRGLEGAADELAARSRVEISVRTASRSDGTSFSETLRAQLARAGRTLLGEDVPEVTCFAGHDAGVLAPVMPAGMVLVRNVTGVSHSPQESVELEDAAVAARLVAATLADVGAGRG
jgi:beta-ureidopropionase / N-carbamoyl-L-amino-acid hydrolase